MGLLLSGLLRCLPVGGVINAFLCPPELIYCSTEEFRPFPSALPFDALQE